MRAPPRRCRTRRRSHFDDRLEVRPSGSGRLSPTARGALRPGRLAARAPSSWQRVKRRAPWSVAAFRDGQLVESIDTSRRLPIACCLSDQGDLTVTFADTSGLAPAGAIAQKVVATEAAVRLSSWGRIDGYFPCSALSLRAAAATPDAQGYAAYEQAGGEGESRDEPGRPAASRLLSAGRPSPVPARHAVPSHVAARCAAPARLPARPAAPAPADGGRSLAVSA